MNSDQEKALFAQYQWEYDYVGRVWAAPDGTKLPQDALMELTANPEGEMALLRLIVECGNRKV